jgi:general stress protein 26
MAIARIENDCEIWFFSSIESGKVHEIECDSRVSVICQKHDLFLSLSGQASVSRERARIAELWMESFKPWFPLGADDPAIALVSVKPSEGEYWDGEGFNKIKYLFQTAHAFATGTPIRVEEGEQHAKVRLS